MSFFPTTVAEKKSTVVLNYLLNQEMETTGIEEQISIDLIFFNNFNNKKNIIYYITDGSVP